MKDMCKYKLSVIIPTFNTGDLLKDLFDSIKNQTIGFDNVEIIFVDDASSDAHTLDLINSYESDYSNCKAIFLNENSSFPGKPRNIGLEASTSDFVIFADHDDSYNPDAFEKLYNKITEENADFVISNYYKVYSNKKVKEKTVFNGESVKINDISQDLRFFEIGPSIWTKLFRKKFLIENNIKFLEGMLAEDMYFYVKSLLKGKNIVYLDNVFTYNYSIRDSSEDKSTIHIRNKKYLSKMICGYFETWNLLKSFKKEEYYSVIFKRHLIYWLSSFIASDITDKEKKDLLIAIIPLLKKQVILTPNFDEKRYSSLTKPILNEDFDEIINQANKIKKYRFIIEKIKSFF